MIDILKTAEFWNIADDAFFRPQNITFDRQIFLITKQLWGQPVENFYSKLMELTKNCD